MRIGRSTIAALAITVLLSVFELGSQSLQPAIFISSFPAWGQDGSIVGTISGTGPRLSNLYMFAFVPDMGWMGIAGSCAAVPIEGSGFSINAAPNVLFRSATRFSAYLVPDSLVMTCSDALPSVPFLIQHNATASVTFARLPQYSTISFGGLDWFIKDAAVQVYPGPQFFNQSNAFVDGLGQLHLRVSPCGGSWCAAEVYTKQAVGYGTYQVSINSQLNNVDPNIALGFFVWDGQAADQNFREWDVEVSRWGNGSSATNAQYVVQPYNGPNNLQRFTVNSAPMSTHVVSWSPPQVAFTSSTPANGTIGQWSFSGPSPVPSPGDVHLHLNFYVAAGKSPAVPIPQEVVISAFRYTPAGAQIGFPRSADNISFNGGTYSVPLTGSSSSCAATIDTDSAWLSISGASLVPAGAPIQYSVSPNLGLARTGNLILRSNTCNPTLGAQVLSVNQAGLVCAPTFSTPSTHIGFLQSAFSVGINGIAPVCTWTVASSASWLQVLGGSSGAGNGTVQLSVNANSELDLRGAVLSLSNGQIHSVYQDGVGTLLGISPSVANSCAGQSASFGVSWVAPSIVELHLNSATGPLVGQFGPSGSTVLSGITDGTVIFLIQTDVPHRVLASARASVKPNCGGSGISPLGVVNAASYTATPLAPGSLASVFGYNLTPSTMQASGGVYQTNLGGATISLGGQLCPLWYVSPGQFNFIVPTNLAPGRYVLSVGSAATDALIASVSPGIFTAKGDGTGAPLGSLVAVLADGSTVSLLPYQCSSAGCATTPLTLPAGVTDLYIVLYGTGIRSYRSISALVGNTMAEVPYVGSQAQFPGLDQVNLHLKGPITLSGTQLVQLSVDGVLSNPVYLQFQ